MTGALKPGQLGGLKVRKASESRANPTLLIYGEGGSGKTTLAASACEVPELSPVLHLNIENGADSIRSNDTIEVVDIDTITELQAVYNDLRNHDGAGYKTVIVDNLTEAQSQGIDHILKTRTSNDFVEFEGASWGNGAYNRSSEQMRKLMRYFRDLPMYTIFVAWERDYSESNIPKWGPSFTKTFGQEAPGLVNDVYRLTVKGDKRVLQTNLSDKVSAKDRTRTLPNPLIDPTMQKIWDYWTGKLVKDSEPAQTETLSKLKKLGAK